jgi:hypothetical protein
MESDRRIDRAGGVFVRGYAGGLANALVFGLQGAATALQELRTAPAGLSMLRTQRLLPRSLRRR